MSAIRITVVWGLLILATLASYTLGHGTAIRVKDATLAIIVIAFIKARGVMREFMELRCAPLKLRFLSEAWILLVGSTLIVLFLHNAS
jgi:Prokaryotic Cytochrome C oxidase subunit IV